ncbi:MAG: protein phosphatase 2C domain-containing protein [Acidobacteriota bacterium]|jgi:protein phosphatase|nr:protein phosphatase 2C domain-containing protein [Acidobacteriota bacterium]
MRIKLNTPCALNEIGGRDNSEDSIFPEKDKATADNWFFLVCDGVGGHQQGEVASRAVCDGFAAFLEDKKPEDFDRAIFQKALEYAFERLNQADTGNSADGVGGKMGTTLTFAGFHPRGALLAHIGDSRVYHLRKQGGHTGILYKSRDHSLVNDLIRANIITAEEAANHSKKNVLTRVMQAHQEKQAEAEIYETAAVAPGDYFFLCTDGVLEAVGDELLCDIMGREGSDPSKIAAINDICRERSRDNFSAYLIPVAEVIHETGEETGESAHGNTGVPSEIKRTARRAVSTFDPAASSAKSAAPRCGTKLARKIIINKKRLVIGAVICALLLVGLGILFCR